ncbi:MAG: Tol-Pal system protein TolB, partial [Henriciella sp.]|nr:Tol-Pal system protein TolB [Henriciella sp.]
MMKSIAAYLFAAFVAVIPAATAQVTVNISEGTLKPTPIAIPVFEAEGADRQLATDITSVIQNDLLSTGLFEITLFFFFFKGYMEIYTQ